MKRIFAIVLISCMLLCTVSCKNTQDIVETDTGCDAGTTDTDQLNSEDHIAIVEDGVPLYAIVCSDSLYKEAALFLQSNLKNKTGIDFDVYSFEVDTYERFIYIGYDYNKLELDGEKLTYSGKAIAHKDGNIYICGYQSASVGSAVQNFSSAIDPDKHVFRGDTVKVVFPMSALMISNPSYSVKSPTLLSSSLSEYRIVVSKMASDVTSTLMKALVQDIGMSTGVFINKVSDAVAAVDKEIVIGDTSRPQSEALIAELGSDEYRIKNYGDTVYVVYGSLLAYSDAIDALKGLYDGEVEEEIDVKGKVSETYGLHKEDESYLRIMSSNVLFYVSDHRDDYFSSAGRQYVNADCYLTYLPDIIGLQEVCDKNRPILERELASAYAVVESEKSAYEYTPIFYLKDKYFVKESKFELFDVGGCWSYTWALFGKTDDPDNEFIVVNLHYSPFSTETRMPGVLEMNEELKRLQGLYPTTPMFVTGDYNCFVDSEEHKAMFDGLANPMLSGIQVAEQRGKDGFDMDHVAVTTDLVTVKQFHGIWNPIYEHGSDHVPIFIDVSINS